MKQSKSTAPRRHAGISTAGALIVVLLVTLTACGRGPAPGPHDSGDYLPPVELPSDLDRRSATLDTSGSLRINAGGPTIDVGGVTWHTDQDFQGGKPYESTAIADIQGTELDALYLSERSGSANLAGFAYNVPLPRGGYEVRLHFAEIYWGATGGGPGGAGKRVFSVNIEGEPVELVDYDINADVGPETAVVKSYATTVDDCFLDLTFTASVNRPKISAIEIVADATLSTAVDAPSVTATEPADCAVDVPRDVAVVSDLYLPNAGVDESTLSSATVRLYRSADGAAVAGTANTSGGNDSLVFQPADELASLTRYTFEVTSGVKDEFGASFAPYSMEFVTGTESRIPADPDADFSRRTVFTGDPLFSIAFGPDGKLYGAGLNGTLHRWSVDATGELVDHETSHGLEGRAVIGLAFHPDDAQNAFIWTTNNDSVYIQPAEDFSGRVSRFPLANFNAADPGIEDYIVGLPRSTKDHMSNSLAFGPDGYLYLTQGGNSAMGAPDSTWGDRPERLLTAAVLRIDPNISANELPIDVQTEAYGGTSGSYDPYAPGAPVTLYATGLRNAYDLTWHSNGFLYASINGSNAGGNAPASPDASIPAITNGPTQDDYLARIDPQLYAIGQTQYFGHPNPLRGEYVLNGGNPTSSVDPHEVIDTTSNQGYPVGISPDPNFVGFAWNFGRNRSANGIIEYTSETFGGALKGRLLVAEYSAGKDIISLAPGIDGDIPPFGATVVFPNLGSPLDLVEDRSTGNLYVSEYTSGETWGRLSLLDANDLTTTNQPPTVDAGPDQSVVASDGTALLSGTASDPDFDALTTAWTQVSGPATATFDDPASLTTSVWLPTAGSYVLELTADDGAATTSDIVSVEVIDDSVTWTSMLRINAGGGAITLGGIDWNADQHHDGGNTYRNDAIPDIQNTDHDELYRTERSATTNLGSFAYHIPVPASATYQVNLHFAEIYWNANCCIQPNTLTTLSTLDDPYIQNHALQPTATSGDRIFTVDLEDAPAELVDYDINADVGPQTAVIKTYQVDVTDGTLDITLTATANRPKISAIEILTSDGTVPDNLPPSAHDLNLVTPYETPIDVTLSGSDPDGDPLTFTVVASPTNGTLSGTAPDLTYTPDIGHAGDDAFTYRAHDGTVASADATVTITTLADAGSVVARINAGGGAITLGGIDWNADQHHDGGNTYRNDAIPDIQNTDHDELYRTERSATTNLGSFAYHIPVPASATYQVNLHFAEIYWNANCCIQPNTLTTLSTLDDPYIQNHALQPTATSGDRIFTVDLEDAPAELVDYDINADVGPQTAVIKTYQVDVTDGTLDITLTASANRPKISAIEVLEVP